MSRARFIASITGRPAQGWTIESIIEAVTQQTGVTRRAILSRVKTRNVTAARQEVMRRAYFTGLYSLPEIGRALGRDHTTVSSGIRRACQRRTQ
jgi:chromosomal replication initiation ATPase DnaA